MIPENRVDNSLNDLNFVVDNNIKLIITNESIFNYYDDNSHKETFLKFQTIIKTFIDSLSSQLNSQDIPFLKSVILYILMKKHILMNQKATLKIGVPSSQSNSNGGTITDFYVYKQNNIQIPTNNNNFDSTYTFKLFNPSREIRSKYYNILDELNEITLASYNKNFEKYFDEIIKNLYFEEFKI